MNDDLLRYDRLVEKALRGVVRETLEQIAKLKSLPGDHHFYITFDTHDPRVEIPDYLRKQYPDEMTIVLQYQFYDLDVSEDFIKVTLSFNNKLERLVVPLASVTSFADPSVSFALQFQSMMIDEGDEDEEDDSPPVVKTPNGGAEIVTLDAFRKKQEK